MIGRWLAGSALCAGLLLGMPVGGPSPAAAGPFGLAAALPAATRGLTEEVRYRRHWRHRHYRHRRHWHRHHHWRHRGHRAQAPRAWREPLVFRAGREPRAAPGPRLY